MEQEKLEEANKFLAEDKEKFQKILSDSEKFAKAAADEVKAKIQDKIKLQKELEGIMERIAKVESDVKRTDEELTEQKYQKRFLDILAIQAGKKQYMHRKKGVNEPLVIEQPEPEGMFLT